MALTSLFLKKFCAYFCMALSLGTVALAQTPAWPTKVALSVTGIPGAQIGVSPQDGQLIDVNNDGLVDVIATGKIGSSPALFVWLQNADHTFSAPISTTLALPAGDTETDPSDVYATRTGDLDGDGLPEYVTTFHNDDICGTGSLPQCNLWVTSYKNLGGGHFSAQPSGVILMPGHMSMGRTDPMRIFDANGDGKADLVVAGISMLDNDEMSLTTFLGNGTADLSGLSSLQNLYDVSSDLIETVSDFNGDGKADLAIAAATAEGATTFSSELLIGKGDGTFSVGAQLPNTMTCSAAGNFTGSGVTSCVGESVDAQASSVSLYLLTSPDENNDSHLLETAPNDYYDVPSTYGRSVTLPAPVTYRGSAQSIAFGSAGALYLMANNGSGAFSAPVLATNPLASSGPCSDEMVCLIDIAGQGGPGLEAFILFYDNSYNYDTATGFTLVEGLKSTPQVTVACSPNPLVYDAGNSTCTATVSNNATGSLTFTYDGITSTKTLSNGSASFEGFDGVPVGSYTVTASYAGDTYHNTASGSTTLTIEKATPTVVVTCSPNPITYDEGNTTCSVGLTGNATGSVAISYNGTAWGTKTLSGGDASITGLDGKSAGRYTIAAAYGGDANNNSSSGSTTLVIAQQKAGEYSLTWATPAPITYGTPLTGVQLDATAGIGGTYAYTPSAGAVLHPGTQTLSVVFTPTDTTDYATGTASVQLVVNKATPVITWHQPAPITYGTALSSTQLDATASVPGTFVYSPAAGSVLSAGSQTLSVTFTPADTTDYKTATASVSLTVNKATPVITWLAPAPITYGTALSGTQLDASANVPGSFVYSPASGTVLVAGNQTLNTMFTPTDTNDYNSVPASVSLIVLKATPVITWPAPAPITYGTALSSAQLDATVNVPGTLTYSPSEGTVLRGGDQTLSVSFTPTDIDDYTTAAASVPLLVNKAMPTITWVPPTPINYGTALSGLQLDATASVPGSMFYAPASGKVFSAGMQTLSVTFTPNDTEDYAIGTATVPLVVDKVTPVITWANPAPITYGTPLGDRQLDASTTILGTFVYSPAAGTILHAGTRSLSVTFTPTNSEDFTTATASVSLLVNKATPTIAWATPAAITYGTVVSTTQLDAQPSVPGGMIYNLSPGTKLSSGAHTLTVALTPDDAADYNPANATVQLMVNDASVSLTWAQPAPIVYGTALSSIQLDAVASKPGTFVYSPAAGTVLTAGQHTLAVTFTPTSNDYSPISSTVTILVGKATPVITWSNPAPVPDNTPLGPDQLNAVGSVPGTFVYTPGTGVQMTEGTHTLSTVLTPTDALDYNAATAQVQLEVRAEDFALEVPQATTFQAGGSLVGPVTITPINGFEGAVSLSCSNLPATITCDLDSGTVTIAHGVTSRQSTQVTVASIGRNVTVLSGLFLFGLGFVRRRRRWTTTTACAALMTAVLAGCGASHFIQNDGTPPGNYSVVVTAKSGSITHTQTVNFTVVKPQ